MSNFPTNIDSPTDPVASDKLNSPSHAGQHTAHNSAIVAIQTWIGALGASLFASRSSKTTPVDADVFGLNDSAASNALKKVTWANIKATLATYFSSYFASGWIPVSDTWTYASANTINVPAGAASIYQVGDRLKLANSGAKQFYIVAVADTLLTVTAGSETTLTSAAISDIYYSHQENPLGFQQHFNYTPTGVANSNVTLSGRFNISEKRCFVELKCLFSGGITFTTNPTLPVASNSNIVNISGSAAANTSGVGGYYDNGTSNNPAGLVPFVNAGESVVRIFQPSNGNLLSATVPITWANGDAFMLKFSYEI
jgi:hypothetical protein